MIDCPRRLENLPRKVKPTTSYYTNDPIIFIYSIVFIIKSTAFPY